MAVFYAKAVPPDFAYLTAAILVRYQDGTAWILWPGDDAEFAGWRRLPDEPFRWERRDLRACFVARVRRNEDGLSRVIALDLDAVRPTDEILSFPCRATLPGERRLELPLGLWASIRASAGDERIGEAPKVYQRPKRKRRLKPGDPEPEAPSDP